MTDKARGDRGGDHELLRLALLAALRDGDFGDRQSVREERREGRQERRDDRQEVARRSGRRPRVVTPCASCGASRRGFWRSAVGQRGTSRGSPGTSRRSTRGREERRDDRQESRSDRGGDHELLRLALLAALRDGDFGDRQSVREERREGRQERRRSTEARRRDDRQSRAATAIRIETAGRCGHKRTAETWGAVVDQRRRLIARA